MSQIPMYTPISMYTPTRDYQNHKSEYDSAIQTVLDSGYFIGGPQITSLEQKLANYVNVKHCISVSNGTDALLVALMALDIKPDDEVITVAHTWIASSEVIKILGAKPVFIDIDPHTFIMDLDLIESAITPKTVGILPVQLYGNMVDIQKIQNIAKQHNLWIIEDGAQSFGSNLNNIKSCQWSTIGCTSFFPSKPLGAYGDAGACFTNDDALANKIRAIKNHGGLVRFKHDYIGLNARMDTLQAVILEVKLKYFDHCLQQRQAVATKYSKELANVNGLIVPKNIEGLSCAWAQYSLLVEKEGLRDTIVDKLKEKGIQISIFYPKGLHQQPCFNDLGPANLPNTDYVCNHILNIPIFAELTETETDFIIQSVKEIFETINNS